MIGAAIDLNGVRICGGIPMCWVGFGRWRRAEGGEKNSLNDGTDRGASTSNQMKNQRFNWG